jgi:outer membrane protein TolC
MADSTAWPRWFLARIFAGLGLPVILSVTSATIFQELCQAAESPRTAVPAASAVQVREELGAPTSSQLTHPLNLAECLQLAMEKQPALAAHRASLAGAIHGSQTADDVRIPTFIAKEVPVRRKQAALGVQIMSAGLSQAELEARYAVTRTYFTVLYAREQERVAREIAFQLKATRDGAQGQVDQGSREIDRIQVEKLTVFWHMAETRLIQASQGVKRATGALREAIGIGPDCPLEVFGDKLPETNFQLNKDEIVRLALAKRGELTQAATAAEVTALEIDAQGTSHTLKKMTFAAMSDLHAREVPQGISNGEYRPGAVGLEMPPYLAGPRSARMEHARILNDRAGAVVEKARNLIALEAEDAFLRWQEATLKLVPAKDAAVRGAKLAQDMAKAFPPMGKTKVEDFLMMQVASAQARAQYNEVLFQQILTLAGLERITGGGFCAGFTDLPVQGAPRNANNQPNPTSKREGLK